MKNKYSHITQEQFQDTLEEVVGEQIAAQLLSIPGVYEAVSEHFNNEVLDRLVTEEDEEETEEETEED